jgi:hypothetical protein
VIRRVLSRLLGRGAAGAAASAERPAAGETGRRIELAQRRLKATIPPLQDED